MTKETLNKTSTMTALDEKKFLREEDKRMNEIMGAMMIRSFFPSRKYRSSERDGKMHHVRYVIKSVFPNRYTMNIAYNLPTDNIAILSENQANDGTTKIIQ